MPTITSVSDLKNFVKGMIEDKSHVSPNQSAHISRLFSLIPYSRLMASTETHVNLSGLSPSCLNTGSLSNRGLTCPRFGFHITSHGTDKYLDKPAGGGVELA